MIFFNRSKTIKRFAGVWQREGQQDSILIDESGHVTFQRDGEAARTLTPARVRRSRIAFKINELQFSMCLVSDDKAVMTGTDGETRHSAVLQKITEPDLVVT